MTINVIIGWPFQSHSFSQIDQTSFTGSFYVLCFMLKQVVALRRAASKIGLHLGERPWQWHLEDNIRWSGW